MKKLAVFASGAGSNAQRIMERFRQHPGIQVSVVVCNRPGAGVIGIAQSSGVPVLMIERERFMKGDAYIPELESKDIDVIILAGFLWKVPNRLVEAYRGRILNIHPALLPSHGGKGMYGMHVHESVIHSGDQKSGITIHLVDELYDHGTHVFQAEIPIHPSETPESLAARIHELEHRYFPAVIEKFVLGAEIPVDLSSIESLTS
jgi:formyltetrahydrofolate-dependent phosphoribosylglycinamide formyltransferase